MTLPPIATTSIAAKRHTQELCAQVGIVLDDGDAVVLGTAIVETPNMLRLKSIFHVYTNWK